MAINRASISKELLIKALNFAREFTHISGDEEEIILVIM